MTATLKKSLFAAVWILLLTFPMAGLRLEKDAWGLRPGAFVLAAAVLAGGLLWACARPLGSVLRAAGPALRRRSEAAVPPRARRAVGIALTVLAAAALLTLPFWGEPKAINKYLSLGFETCLFAVLALGLNVTVGWAGLLVLGYAALFGLGAYSYAILNLHFGLPFWPGLLVGGAVAGLSGFLLGLPSLRLRGDYLAIVTLGFGEIVRYLLKNLSPVTGGEKGLPNEDLPGNIADPRIFSWVLDTPAHYYYLALALLALSVFVARRLNSSRVGRAWIAIREDEIAAQAMGIHTLNLKLLAFTVSSVFAGVAGVLYAARMNFVNPEAFKFDNSVLVLSMVILGGMGSIAGVVAGAALLWLLPWALRDPVPTLLSGALPEAWGKNVQDYRLAAFGLLLVLMMIFRPEGLIGEKRRRIEEALPAAGAGGEGAAPGPSTGDRGP